MTNHAEKNGGDTEAVSQQEQEDRAEAGFDSLRKDPYEELTPEAKREYGVLKRMGADRKDWHIDWVNIPIPQDASERNWMKWPVARQVSERGPQPDLPVSGPEAGLRKKIEYWSEKDYRYEFGVTLGQAVNIVAQSGRHDSIDDFKNAVKETFKLILELRADPECKEMFDAYFSRRTP